MADVIDNCEQCISGQRPQQRTNADHSSASLGRKGMEPSSNNSNDLRWSSNNSGSSSKLTIAVHGISVGIKISSTLWNIRHLRTLHSSVESRMLFHTLRAGWYKYVQSSSRFARSARHCRMSRSFRLWRSLSAGQHTASYSTKSLKADRG
jgi:hypothetical protein